MTRLVGQMTRLFLAFALLLCGIVASHAAFIAFGVNGATGSAPVVNNGTASLSLPLSTSEAVNTMTASNTPTSWTAGSCSGCTGWFAIDNSGNVTVTSTGASSATAGTWTFNVTATNGAGTSPSGTDTITISATITGVTVAGGTTVNYTSGISSGTSIGSIAVQETGGTFGGTIALGGTDAAKFSLSGTSLPATLNANGSTPTCSSPTNYSITITPTQSGVTNSGTPYGITVTCNPAMTAQGVGPSSTLYASNPYYTCGTNYYVTASAGGSGNGTSGNPWTLSQAAGQSVAAGSCINMAAGTYTLSGVNPISFPHGGSAPSSGASFPATTYVVWRCQTMPFGFSSGVFQGEGGASSCHIVQSGTNGGNLVNGLTSYIMFDGIEFDGASNTTQSSCVDDEGNGGSHHHIWFFNSDFHGCGQSGIQINQADWIYVIHNYWHDNSATNGVDGSGLSFYEPTLTSGHSLTTQDNAFQSTTAGVTFHIVVEYNVGVHNYNNFSNCTDGEGVILDDWGWNQNSGSSYTGTGLVMGNVMYFNGGGGIEVFSEKNTTGATWIVNNTMYNDYWSTCNTGTYRADSYTNNTYNMHVINNIAQSVGGGGILANNVPILGHCNSCGSNVWQTNIGYGANSSSTFDSPNTFPTTGGTKNDDNSADPKFTSITPSATSGNNFTLQASSPAIGFGQAFDLWQQSGTVDAGACPYSSPGPVTSCP